MTENKLTWKSPLTQLVNKIIGTTHNNCFVALQAEPLQILLSNVQKMGNARKLSQMTFGTTTSAHKLKFRIKDFLVNVNNSVRN